MLHTRALPGGLTLLVDELPHTRSVSVGFFIGVGSGHEPAEVAGISHLIEHLLFKGSAGYPTPKLISDTIEGVGGILDAYTDTETTVYYAKVADTHAERAIALLGDMLCHPLLAPADLRKERRVILEELRETADTPSERVHLLLDQSLWGEQALGRDIAGDAASLARITIGQVRAHWRRFYTRANTIISIAGNITAERAAELVERALRDMPAGAAAGWPPSAPPQPGPTILISQQASEQSSFCIGYPGLATHDPQRRALLALDTIIGGGSSSRLFQAIREERGLAYSIGSYSREHPDAGKWVVYGSVDPGKLAQCVAAVLAELRRARADGLSADELDHVKEQVKGGILLSLEDTWSIASRNGAHQQRYGHVIPVAQVVAEVEAVTLDDLRAVARRVLRDDALHLAVIGPAHDAARLRARLQI